MHSDTAVITRWETVGKKDGQVVGSATYQVSNDRRVLKISAAQQLVVLNRAEDANV